MNRFIRFESLVGTLSYDKIKSKSILLFGLGGVGSYVLEALARCGIETFHLVDFDVVDETNINRQIIALSSTIGRPKVEVAKERVLEINPSAHVFIYQEKCSLENIDFFTALQPDFIIDAIDDLAAKADLISACVAKNQKIISSMGFANKMEPDKIRISTLQQTKVCPLAKTLRYMVRKRDTSLHIPVVYSIEEPKQVQSSTVRLASNSFVPASAGLYIASYVIQQMLEKE